MAAAISLAIGLAGASGFFDDSSGTARDLDHLAALHGYAGRLVPARLVGQAGTPADHARDLLQPVAARMPAGSRTAQLH